MRLPFSLRTLLALSLLLSQPVRADDTLPMSPAGDLPPIILDESFDESLYDPVDDWPELVFDGIADETAESDMLQELVEAGPPPLRALILTSPGVYHNYEQQFRDIAYGIAERANVRFAVSLAEIDRWRYTDFSEGFDVLIYNICMADNQDADLIANLRRQTEELGVPAVFIHCSMHSFRQTDLWWPLLGLQSKTHEPKRALRQLRVESHPILTGIPENWVLPEDELYTVLAFEGEALLYSPGEDETLHPTAWLHYRGLTPVFGTTLGHNEHTMKNHAFHQLLANAVLYVTGNLTSDGRPVPGKEPFGDGMYVFESFSAPDGVRFLGKSGMDCAWRKIAIAAAPCYLKCSLNPFEWGAKTRACKRACEAKLPGSEELIAACTPGD